MSRIASPYTPIDNADVIIETIDNAERLYLQKIAWFDYTISRNRFITIDYVRRHVIANGWTSAAAFSDDNFRRSNIDWRYLTTHYTEDLAEYRSNR